MKKKERLEFIEKLWKAKEIALANAAPDSNVIFDALEGAGLLYKENYKVDSNNSGSCFISSWLVENGINAKNISVVFDNSIAAQEKLL